MNNLIVLPLIIPIMVGVVLVFLRPYVKLQRVISLITMIGIAAISILILNSVQRDGIIRLDFGGWGLHSVFCLSRIPLRCYSYLLQV